ncbi:MAG: molybdenum cofactor guanylyltransferase [Planctomycetaceae bacterium]|nr:molybdenum cofactor guanylyltransferase [Planctomycetaceae bacterium]
MITNDQLAGIVLCGGSSRRMGQEKYQLPFLGETLLQRICRIVRPEVSQILIVAAANQQILLSGSSVEVLRDDLPGAGPLAGIGQALRHLQTSASSPVAGFVTSCDVPLLRAAVINCLRMHLTHEFDAVVIRDQGFSWPLCAVYRVTAANTAADLLKSGQRRAAALAENLRTCWLSLEVIREVDPNLACLMNCNTPADVEAALRHQCKFSSEA